MLNRAGGLNQDHLWFFGTDQDYWNSDVQYRQPDEIEQSPAGQMRGGEEYDAGEITIGRMARQLGLEEGDRICSLFDYGDEWRFSAILKEITEDEGSSTEPPVVTEKGDPVEQYPRRGDGR